MDHYCTVRDIMAVIHSWRIWGILPDISTLMTAWKMNIIVMQRMP
ncbi:mannitol dehydrogenase domain protein [Escherichia coli DEC1D]|nr:mannitol dehydrogenase domain protein [Escherichia coli DEC1D]